MTTPHVALLTREFPPDVYGGAGVHVGYLARELASRAELTVHCWGSAAGTRVADGLAVRTHPAWDALEGGPASTAALRALSIDLTMAAAADGADLVHSHTWYANLAGHLAKLLHGIPHVATVHSLEPMRPWKAEQLGGGYAVSTFCERAALEAADAVIAVSAGHRQDILQAYPAVAADQVHVIYNGIDTTEYRPDPDTGVLARYGLDPARPIVLFVGRITRQKGLPYLLAAADHLEPGAQLVLCAGAPDTPELAEEVAAAVRRLSDRRGNVVWIAAVLPRPEVVQLLSHATVFVCPSIYEPLGIVNLEAMACSTAVVATDTGGIPEVVRDGETGLLVPFEVGDPATRAPRDPDRFARDLADRVNTLVADPRRAAAMGTAGRKRAVEQFSWSAVADQTVRLYRDVLGRV